MDHPDVPFLSGPSPDADANRLPTVVAAYPMTRSQEGLWRAYCISPQSTYYNLLLRVRLNRLDVSYNSSVEALLRAIMLLTTRHAILRSTFQHPDEDHLGPFVAEHDPALAIPAISVTQKPEDSQAYRIFLSTMRTAVDLTSVFATRWYVVLGPDDTELFLVSHHIALDGQSMSQLSEQLMDSLKTGKKLQVRVPNDTRFCRAHILENAFLSSQKFDEAKEFWTSQTRNTRTIKWRAEPSTLPAQDVSDYRKMQTWYELSTSELHAISTRYKTSWFRVAVALIGVLVRALAQPDGGADHTILIAFGGRPEGTERTVGQFANALPIRIPLADAFNSDTPSFEALVRLVSQTISTAKKHELFSYIDILKSYQQKGLQVPEAQVAITFSPKLSRPECSLYPVEGVYDLFFCFLEGLESVSLKVIYDPRIFSTQDILLLKDQFRSLNQLSVSDVVPGLRELAHLRPHFPHLIADIDLSNVKDIDSTRFHTLFERRAAHDPNLLALYSAERNYSLTYEELNREANQLAHHLRNEGVSRGSIVLLHLARGFPLMTWILAILKSGGAFVVADQTRPLAHTRSIISIAKPSVLVDDGNGEDLRSHSEGVGAKVIYANNFLHDPMPFRNLDDATRDDDLAYISFTSGSTGQPKGVEIEHRNLSHFIVNSYASNYAQISPGSRVLQWASFAFDAAVIEWAQCLSLGGTLCFSDVPEALTGNYLADVIDANEISFINVTAGALATLPTSRSLTSLRQISVGGEMVPENLLRQWGTRVQVQNAYGPTECTAVMSHHPQPKSSDVGQHSSGVIGKPHRHMKFYISDEAFTHILQVDEVGEVCIAGPQVGRGYKGKDDLTRSRFAVHPKTGERVYRTGDRGKLLLDGSVILLGRMDREVKLRGYRIELDSIEKAIYDVMPKISATSLQVDEAGTQLYAFVTPRDLDCSALRRILSKQLPHYMIPDVVYALDSLPLNANGKVDHKSIKTKMAAIIAGAAATTMTSSLVEPGPLDALSGCSAVEIISKIWQNVLNTSQLPSPNENFFDLGGNSLSVQTLCKRLQSNFPSTKITVVDLFASHTVAAQANIIESSLSKVDQPRLMSSTKPPHERLVIDEEQVTTEILGIWKVIFGVREVDLDASFLDVGGNSLSISQLLGNLRLKWPMLYISVTDLFQYVTPRTQATLISEHLRESTPAQLQSLKYGAELLQSAASLSVSQGHEVAIVGLAGRFPNASNPEELFQLLLDQGDGMTRFNLSPSASVRFEDAIYVPKRGAIPNVEEFDFTQWGLTAGEARAMDPQQRQFMDVAREALEDAGHIPSPVGYNNVGLCVGAAQGTWQLHHKPTDGDDFLKAHRANMTPSISARTAYHLNLHGPNVTLNTACSSGLVAMSLAVDHLRSGQCDMSIAGGVSITFPQEGYSFTAENQLLSPSGECRPFDHKADGTLPGDAVCAVVLRRLDDALRDGDKIYAVVSGIATGSDGGSEKGGPLTPSAKGQANTIVRAWKDSGLPANRLAYAELHGSGTLIGDAIELEGFTLSRKEMRVDGASVQVGSNKGNLGNCEAAGGLVSVIKMCKSLEKGVVPPVKSFEKLNPLVNSNASFSIADTKLPLTSDVVVSVSSIGLGGVNAHCILRSPPSSARHV